MADAEVNGEQTLDAGRLRQVALSSSTKRRSAELLSLHDKIVSKGVCHPCALSSLPVTCLTTQCRISSRTTTQPSQSPLRHIPSIHRYTIATGCGIVSRRYLLYPRNRGPRV